MSTAARIMTGGAVLMIFLPILVHELVGLLLPVAALVVVFIIARLVWFHTRM